MRRRRCSRSSRRGRGARGGRRGSSRRRRARRAAGRIAVTRVPSWTSTPASTARCASPTVSLPGWRPASRSTRSPPKYASVPISERSSDRGTNRAGEPAAFSSSAAARRCGTSSAPYARSRWPDRTMSASIPSVSRSATTWSTDATDSAKSARPVSAPYFSTSSRDAVLVPGEDHPAVAGGGAPAERLGLDEDDRGAGTGELAPGGEPGDPAADDDDVDRVGERVARDRRHRRHRRLPVRALLRAGQGVGGRPGHGSVLLRAREAIGGRPGRAPRYSAMSAYASRPPAAVRRTRPGSSRPSSGVFFPFERSAARVTSQRSLRSNTTRSAGAPSTRPRPASRPVHAARTRAGPAVSAPIAAASGSWPASTAASSVPSAVSIPLIPFDARPNSTSLSTSVWGAWSVATASAVPSTIAARTAAALAGSRSGGLTRHEGSYGPATSAPSVHGSRALPSASTASQAQRRAPAIHSSREREVVRRDVARHREAGGLRAADDVDRLGGGEVRQVEARARDLVDDPREDGEVARDGRLLGGRRPAAQPEDRCDEPLVGLGVRRERRLLGMLDDRAPEHPGIPERVREEHARLHRRAVVGEADDARVDELAERGEALPSPAGGDRADDLELDRRPGGGRGRADERDGPRGVGRGGRVRHDADARVAAVRRRREPRRDRLRVLEAGLAEVRVEVDEPGGDDDAVRADPVGLVALEPRHGGDDAVGDDDLARTLEAGVRVDEPRPRDLEIGDDVADAEGAGSHLTRHRRASHRRSPRRAGRGGPSAPRRRSSPGR